MQRRLPTAQSGFLLVEVVVAIAIAGLALLALALSMAGGVRAVQSGRTTAQATALARRAIEAARALGWDALAHPVGAAGASTYDPDAAGSLPTETVVESGDGGVSSATTETFQGTVFDVRLYVTNALTAAGAPLPHRRVSAVVSWTDGNLERQVTAGTLVHPLRLGGPGSRGDPSGSSPPPPGALGAAAHVVDGVLAGVRVGPVSSVEVDASGDRDEKTAASFAPAPGIGGTAARAIAEVVAATSAHAEASASTVDVSLTGLGITASGISVRADASAGGTSAVGSGTAIVNGVSHVNPAPGTTVTVPGWRVVLNDDRFGADGSRSIAFIRIEGDAGDEITIAYAWVAAPGDLGV